MAGKKTYSMNEPQQPVEMENTGNVASDCATG